MPPSADRDVGAETLTAQSDRPQSHFAGVELGAHGRERRQQFLEPGDAGRGQRPVAFDGRAPIDGGIESMPAGTVAVSCRQRLEPAHGEKQHRRPTHRGGGGRHRQRIVDALDIARKHDQAERGLAPFSHRPPLPAEA